MFWAFLAVLMLGFVLVKLGMLWVQTSVWEGAFKGLFLLVAGVLGFFGWKRYRERRVGKLPIPVNPAPRE